MEVELYNVLMFKDSNGKAKCILRENEEYQVINNKILLDYIPDKSNKVIINGMYEVKQSQKIADNTQFKVNYTTGEITFHADKNETTVVITKYFAIGVIKTYANRIALRDYSKFVNNDLEGVLTELASRMDNLILANPSPTEVQDSRLDSVNNVSYTFLKDRLNNINTQINGKVKMAKFTATSNSTTHIPHNLSYDSAKDELLVTYKGVLLDSTNYTENADKISIDLTGWSLNTGEVINFRIYKNVK